MKASDIFMAKEPIEYARHDRNVLVIYARRYNEMILLGYEGDNSQNNFPIEEVALPSLLLSEFIDDAKAFFALRKMCGDLTMEDLRCGVSRFIRAGQSLDDAISEWATSRNIQLPEGSGGR